MSQPSKHHQEAFKWILGYLKGTYNKSWYHIQHSTDDPSVVGYMDSDYVGDMDDRRSTTRYVCTLSRRSICWNSTVQSILTMSTAETY